MVTNYVATSLTIQVPARHSTCNWSEHILAILPFVVLGVCLSQCAFICALVLGYH